MKTQLILTFSIALLIATPTSYGHGWSEEMKHELSMPTPDWLSIGKTIKVDPTDDTADDQTEFRPISGESQSTRDRVTIPSRGIEIKVDYPISWYRGSSLSPDGTKLIINSGTDSNVYEIITNGSFRAIELRLPRVTYDAGPKGFIAGWSWADNKTLVGEAEIDNEKGEFIEKRIYVFYVNESVLSRLDVSALNLQTTEGLTVKKVGLDLNRLRISTGTSEVTVKADLKSPPKIDKRETGEQKTTEPLTNPELATPKAPEVKTSETRDESTLSTPWLSVSVIFIVAIGLLFLLIKKRK